MDFNSIFLMEKAGVSIPLVGFYDTPDPSAFEPTIKPIEGRWACLFMFYKNWLKGKTLHLTKENYGCGLLASLFDDLEGSMATIGATDIAMRKFLTPYIMAFTVTAHVPTTLRT